MNLNYAKENIYSPLDVNSIVLPSLPANGSPIYGFGEITSESYTNVLQEGTFGQMDVFDTDRWKLSLSNYPQGQTVRIAAWLALKPQNIDGDVKLDDPWLAVVPSQYLPVPTVNGMQACSDESVPWMYPNSLLPHLYYQVFLAQVPYCSEDMETHACDSSESSEDTGSIDSGSSGSTDIFDYVGFQQPKP